MFLLADSAVSSDNKTGKRNVLLADSAVSTDNKTGKRNVSIGRFSCINKLTVSVSNVITLSSQQRGPLAIIIAFFCFV